jgi:hypothetical protein
VPALRKSSGQSVFARLNRFMAAAGFNCFAQNSMNVIVTPQFQSFYAAGDPIGNVGLRERFAGATLPLHHES